MAGPIVARTDAHATRGKSLGSPPGGYVGGRLQLQVDAQIGPAGDAWVTSNWQYPPAALGEIDEAQKTLGAGQGVVVLYGMAKPVKRSPNGPSSGP